MGVHSGMKQTELFAVLQGGKQNAFCGKKSQSLHAETRRCVAEVPQLFDQNRDLLRFQVAEEPQREVPLHGGRPAQAVAGSGEPQPKGGEPIFDEWRHGKTGEQTHEPTLAVLSPGAEQVSYRT